MGPARSRPAPFGRVKLGRDGGASRVRSASALGALRLLLEQGRNHLVELAAGLDRVELAVGVDDEHGRDRLDPPGPREITLPELALVILGPADVILLNELLELIQSALLLRFVEADPDELDPLVVVF